MGLFNSVLDKLAHGISPNYRKLQSQAEIISGLWDSQTVKNLRPLMWYKVANSEGRIVGFEWTCGCPGKSYTLIGALPYLDSYTCMLCKETGDLFPFCGIDKDTPRSEWVGRLMQLDTRGLVTGPAPGPRVIDTWDPKHGASDGDFKYDGPCPGPDPDKTTSWEDVAFGDPFSVSKQPPRK